MFFLSLYYRNLPYLFLDH